MKTLSFIILLTGSLLLFSNCTTVSKSMKEPNAYVEFRKSDFTISEQVSGSASETKIFGVDVERILLKKKGDFGFNLSIVPLIGTLINPSTADYYALYDMMSKNPGYDVVFYPQFERNCFKVLFLNSKTDVTVTARLGKLNQ